MAKKSKKTKESTELEVKQPGVDYEYYDEAALVIHCNKCNALTHICTKDEEGNIVPIVIKEALDLTKLFGGPMPTDNHSQFPLFCDTCKTMLTLRFAPVGLKEVVPVEGEPIEESIEGGVAPIQEVTEESEVKEEETKEYTPKLEVVK